MITKILVTGSSGTIGTRLCERLLAKGYKVTGIDWKHNKWNKDIDKITIIGDLRDKKTIDKIPKDQDLVIQRTHQLQFRNLRYWLQVQPPEPFYAMEDQQHLLKQLLYQLIPL